MKNRLTIGIIVAVLAATVSYVAAGPYKRVAATEKAPATDLLTSVRLLGLTPMTRPFRQGPFYVLHAVDLRGTTLRVVADADLGDIVSVTPIIAPRYDAGPRIIHVPQPGERASVRERDEAALPDEEVERYVPRERHRAMRRAVHHSEPRAAAAPQRPADPPRPRRNVLSVPPPPGSLSPIYPTPQFTDRFDAKAEAEKFHAPAQQASPAAPSAAPLTDSAPNSEPPAEQHQP